MGNFHFKKNIKVEEKLFPCLKDLKTFGLVNIDTYFNSLEIHQLKLE